MENSYKTFLRCGVSATEVGVIASHFHIGHLVVAWDKGALCNGVVHGVERKETAVGGAHIVEHAAVVAAHQGKLDVAAQIDSRACGGILSAQRECAATAKE